MTNVEAFVAHREVGLYKNDLIIRILLMLISSIAGIALSKDIVVYFCVLVVIAILILYGIVLRGRRKSNLFLYEALQGITVIWAFVIVWICVTIKIGINYWMFMMCLFIILLTVIINIIVIKRKINGNGYVKKSSRIIDEDLRIAIGAVMGLIGYVIADTVTAEIDTKLNLLNAAIIALLCLFTSKCVESLMIHYYVKKYRLESLIRVMNV